MANKILYTPMDGTPKQIVFADHATDFTSPTSANDLRITTDGSNELDVQLDLTSLADSTGYRESAKFDFGADWAQEYHTRGAFELAATPTAGNTIELWMGYSHTSTVGTANPGGLSGSEGAYAGYSSNAADAIKQLVLVSVFVVTAQATTTIQIAEGWTFRPRDRYGIAVVRNRAGSAFHSDAAESHIVCSPVVSEIQ